MGRRHDSSIVQQESEHFFADLLGGASTEVAPEHALHSELFFEELIGAPRRRSRFVRPEPTFKRDVEVYESGSDEAGDLHDPHATETSSESTITTWNLEPTDFTTQAAAVTRARQLQQQHTAIDVFRRTDGKWKVRYRYPLRTGTPPFWDNLYFRHIQNALHRAKLLRAYSYVVKVEERSTGRYQGRITRQILSTPGLPTALGPDRIIYTTSTRAKKRVKYLRVAGFSSTVEQRTDGKWRARITALPTFATPVGGLPPTTTRTGTTATTTATTTTSTTPSTAPVPTPTHTLEQVNAADPDKKKLSSAVVQSFRDWAKDVKDLTDVDIDLNFGDTVRALGSVTTKKGADTVSWHKTGRAADINQGLRWVIREDPSGSDLFFRLYLRHKDRTTAANPPSIVNFPKGTKYHAKWYGTIKPTDAFVDLTHLASQHGWTRIKAHSDWKTNYNGREWWHYEKRGGQTWFQAIRQIYTEAQTVAGLKSFAGTTAGAAKWGDRLVREGVDESTLRQVLPVVTRGSITLLRPVGDDQVNFPRDVKAVQTALIKGGQLAAGKDTGTMDADTIAAINAYQGTIGITKPDGVVSVGGTTHRKLGAL